MTVSALSITCTWPTVSAAPASLYPTGRHTARSLSSQSAPQARSYLIPSSASARVGLCTPVTSCTPALRLTFLTICLLQCRRRPTQNIDIIISNSSYSCQAQHQKHMRTTKRMRTTSNSCAPPATHAHHQQLVRTTSNSRAPHIVSNSCVPPTTRDIYRSCTI